MTDWTLSSIASPAFDARQRQNHLTDSSSTTSKNKRMAMRNKDATNIRVYCRQQWERDSVIILLITDHKKLTRNFKQLWEWPTRRILFLLSTTMIFVAMEKHAVRRWRKRISMNGGQKHHHRQNNDIRKKQQMMHYVQKEMKRKGGDNQANVKETTSHPPAMVTIKKKMSFETNHDVLNCTCAKSN